MEWGFVAWVAAMLAAGVLWWLGITLHFERADRRVVEERTSRSAGGAGDRSVKP